jgi:hypothetical protein
LSCPKSHFQSQDKVTVAELTSKFNLAKALLCKVEETNTELKEEKAGLVKQIKILINAFMESELRFNKNI